MVDPAHKITDEMLERLEKRISKEYKQASEEVEAKLSDYLRRFRKKDEKWRKWVADGTKTKEEYRKWRMGQIVVGKRWKQLQAELANDYHNANIKARQMADDMKLDVYAENHNYSTYEVETGANVNTSYTLYDRDTVKRLIKDNPDLLPPPGKKTSERIASGIDQKWNRQVIQSVMTQAILQGESIPDIATRLADAVGDKNRKAAIRNARTMTTGAESAGRIDGYKRAENMGIDMEQEWLAALDLRTRHEHRMLDHQRVKVGEPWIVDGEEIRFPGDPEAKGYLIYNCRCSVRAIVKGLEPQARKYRDDSAIGGMSYNEWKKQKRSESNPIDLPEKKAKAIKEAYIREYRK